MKKRNSTYLLLTIIILSVGLFLGCKDKRFTSKNLIDYYKSDTTAKANTLIWQEMTGKWYGSQATEHGPVQTWLMNRKENGDYAVTFRMFFTPKKYKETTELGFWGVSGDIEFTLLHSFLVGEKIIPANLPASARSHIYKILKLTKKEIVYQDNMSGITFTMKKVSDDFQQPETLEK